MRESGSAHLSALIAYALWRVGETIQGRVAAADYLLIRGAGLLWNARPSGGGPAFVIPGARWYDGGDL